MGKNLEVCIPFSLRGDVIASTGPVRGIIILKKEEISAIFSLQPVKVFDMLW
jgi:hypothetical protein